MHRRRSAAPATPLPCSAIPGATIEQARENRRVVAFLFVPLGNRKKKGLFDVVHAYSHYYWTKPAIYNTCATSESPHSQRNARVLTTIHAPFRNNPEKSRRGDMRHRMRGASCLGLFLCTSLLVPRAACAIESRLPGTARRLKDAGGDAPAVGLGFPSASARGSGASATTPVQDTRTTVDKLVGALEGDDQVTGERGDQTGGMRVCLHYHCLPRSWRSVAVWLRLFAIIGLEPNGSEGARRENQGRGGDDSICESFLSFIEAPPRLLLIGQIRRVFF